MKSSREREHCFRTILLIISISACISIAVFIFLELQGRQKHLKAEITKGNSFVSERLIDEKCVPVCYSRSCIKQADILLRTINASNDPCENIQKFLCGSYEEKIGRNENRSLMFNDMTEAIMNKVKDIIENTKAEPDSAAEKMKILYDSCVNLGSSELNGVQNFRQILNDVGIFNWPYIAEDFKFSDTGLSQLLAIFRAYAEIEYFGISIESPNKDDIESEEKLVKIFFHPKHFNETPIVPKDVAIDILKYFEMEPQDIDILLTDYDAVRSALISFGEKFKYDGYCEENCNDTHIDCSSTRNDEWAYACEMLKIYLNITNLQQFVSKNEIAVSVYDVLHVKNLIPFLNSLSDRSVGNFFGLHVLWRDMDKLNFSFRLKMRKYFKYFKTERNSKMPHLNTWKYCVTWLYENMKIVLENQLVKNYLLRSYIDEIHDIHQSLTSAVSEIIDQQEWIFPGASEFMKSHISKTDTNMVFLRGLLPNDAYVNKFFEMFNPTPTNFYQNTLSFMKSLMYGYSVHEYKHNRWNEPDLEANAETDYDGDLIMLHYGMFVPPVYFRDHERFIKRILIAPVIIHEIGHHVIFLLDKISNISNFFNERKKCMEDQFSNFKFRFIDDNLNGSKYYIENLSDNLGFAVADKMIDELDSSEVDFFLPGLAYSLKQLLYLSSRQLLCSKISQKQELAYRDTDEKHAPPEYRLTASAQNSKSYSKAFNCAEGSYMNPIEKCIFLDSI